MAVRVLDDRPDAFAHFPEHDRYRWLKLHADGHTYGHAAIAEQPDALELHLTLHTWGANVRRNVSGDLEWLKGEARRLGKSRITGLRVNGNGEFDDKLFRFARMYGFSEMHVYQTASLIL